MSAASLLRRAGAELESARLLQQSGYPEASVSRAYYGIFYAAEAMLLHVGPGAGTHKGLHGLFGRHLIKAG